MAFVGAHVEPVWGRGLGKLGRLGRLGAAVVDAVGKAGDATYTPPGDGYVYVPTAGDKRVEACNASRSAYETMASKTDPNGLPRRAFQVGGYAGALTGAPVKWSAYGLSYVLAGKDDPAKFAMPIGLAIGAGAAFYGSKRGDFIGYLLIAAGVMGMYCSRSVCACSDANYEAKDAKDV